MLGTVIAALMAAVVLVAAFVKGAIGFGFPALGTPLLSLVVDVKTAVVVLILPNIVMDGIQFARRGTPLATVRRFAVLLVAGALGMVLGTRALVMLSSRTATLILGVFVLCFVALNVTGLAPRVPPHWERWLGAPAGFIAGDRRRDHQCARHRARAVLPGHRALEGTTSSPRWPSRSSSTSWSSSAR